MGLQGIDQAAAALKSCIPRHEPEAVAIGHSGEGGAGFTKSADFAQVTLSAPP
jgi:hypothetical protein